MLRSSECVGGRLCREALLRDGRVRGDDRDRPITGHTFVVMVITVAAAEAAVALALAVSVYRNRDTVDVDKLNLLRS